jgi:hypothetical protein
MWQTLQGDAEVKDVFKERLNGLAAEVYGEGTQKLVTGYDNCLNVGGDCMENSVVCNNNNNLNLF